MGVGSFAEVARTLKDTRNVFHRASPMTESVPGLYLVTPVIKETASFLPLLAEALGAAEIASVLLRLGEADARAAKRLIRELAKPVQDQGAALLIDREPELALESGADGVHVTGAQDALTLAIKQLAPDHIVGAGGLATRHDAMAAGEARADYVLFGDWNAPLDSEALLERVQWWAEIFNTPCVALAQELGAVRPLAVAGADFVMLGDCVWNDPRGPAEALKDAQRAVREVKA